MMALLIISILSNFPLTQTVAAQQQDNTPPPFPAPTAVTVIGNFQTAVGCDNDNDPTCSATDLQLDDYGVWSGTFPVPPGTYTYRIVAKADQDRSLGKDATPDGDDIDLDVPDDATGVFFSYNQRTGEIYAAPIKQLVELQTDFGTQPMFPTDEKGDTFFALIDADPGTAATAQEMVNGEPVGDPIQVTIGNGARAIVTGDIDGKLETKELDPVVLNITKNDADGNPLPGSCFSVYDGKKVAGQACDADDGEDGVTQIRFSVGVGTGLKLAESLTPDGQETAAEQDIDLTPGENNVTVTAGGGGTTNNNGGGDTVTVTFQMQDSDGNGITGGCLSLGDLGEQCDDDNDGNIVFENVPTNASYDVTETQAPDGYDTFAGASVDVGDSDVSFQVPHQSLATGGGTGNLTLYTVDSDGSPVPNVCYDITGVDGTQCDEDGDGDMGLTDLPAGDYGAKQNSVPDGYQLDPQEQSATVTDGETAELTFTSPASEAQTFTVNISVVDGDGNAVGGACFSAKDGDGNEVGNVCDDDGDGAAQLTLPNGDYTLTTSTVPDGYTAPDDQQFTVQDGDLDLTVTLTAAQVEETATEESAGNGSIDVAVTDSDGFAIIGACVQLDGPVAGEICDNGDGDFNGEDGQIQIQNLPDGDYTVTVSQLPEGFQPAQPVNVTISGGSSETAQLVSGATEAATEEPTATEAPETGSLLIRKYDPNNDALAGACFTLTDSDGNATEVCDGDQNDSDDRDGRIRIDNLTPGDYTLSETKTPDGYTPGDDQSVTVAAGETARINVTNQQALGTVDVVTTDGTSAVGGACYELSGIGQQCDDDNDGTVEFASVPPGDYTVSQVSVPDGYAGSDPSDQPVSVTADNTSEVDFTVSVATSTISISVVDGDGNAVTGACVTVDNGTEVCDDGSGTITVSDVQPGDHTVTMSKTPDGYADGGSTTVTTTAGQTANVTFTLSVQPGRLDIVTADSDGNRLAGACYSINGGDPICDNDANDGNDNDGVIRVSDLAPGDYTLSQTTAPDTYANAADTTFTITAGQRTRVDITNTPAFGSIEYTINDAATGNPITGACISSDGFNGEICDNGDGDSNPADGVIQVDNVPPGVYSVNISTVPDGYAVAEGGENQVTVVAGETVQASRSIALQNGSVSIHVTESDSGNPITDGVCVIVSDGTGDTTYCDGADGDLSGDPGVIQIGNLDPGDYEAAIDSTTGNYVLPQATFPFTITGGSDTELDIALDLVPPTETETAVPTETETETAVPTETETETAVPTETETAVPTETETAPPTETETAAPTETETETAVPADTDTAVPADTETATTEATSAEPIVNPDDLTASAEAGNPTETETEVTQPTEAATEAPTGSLRINVTDPDGNALAGACFDAAGSNGSTSVCDNDDNDSESADGVIEVADVAIGDYAIHESQAPDGYAAAADQNTTIANGGDTAELTFVNAQVPVATGDLTITSLGTDNAVAGGSCYQLSTTEVCDNGTGDTNNAPGIIGLTGIVVGDYTVTETQAPDGYQAAADQPVTISADQPAELRFNHEAAPPETGGVEFKLQNDAGDPVDGGCIIISGGNGGIDNQTFCDGGDGDQNPDPAVLKLTDLPIGSYDAVQAPPKDAGENAFTDAALDQSNFTVQANIVIQVIVIIIIEPPAIGDLQITKRAADTNALQGGACFRVTGEGNEIEVCDNDDVDLNGATGIIRLEDLGSGNYVIKEITAPPGYQKAPDKNTTIPNGGTRSVLIKDQPVADTTGGLLIHKIDPDGNALQGSCFQLRDQGTPIATVCDADDGTDDGTVTFADITAGDYLLRETKAPTTDYNKAADSTVNVYGGVDDQVVAVVDTLKTGRIRLFKVDGASNPLAGACFGLDRGSGIEFEACDNGAGDTSGTLGTIQFKDVPPGDWTIIETLAPDGYVPSADNTVTLNPGAVESITVINQPEPPSTDKGTVVINKLVDGNLAAGACFSLKQGAVTKYAACDGANNDGVIEFPSVTVGNYTVHETKAPSPTSWYIIGADKNISVAKNVSTEVDVTNKLKPGRILVVKKNTNGSLLQGACFKITPDPTSIGQKCTNAGGQTSFDNLPAKGTYKLTETSAPGGYQTGNPISGITLTPGLTTTVNVVDKKTPPQPTDGSLFVIKFFCPESAKADETTYLDSSDAGPDKLAQTDGCTKGDAHFNFNFGGDGTTKYGFNTGTDGEFHYTLAAGTYTLTETTPNKSDPEQFKIYAGQQTTIVVIDYVKPPAPKPARVNIVKYTCDPGFGGVYYADFLNNCTQDSELTNSISFRTSGPTVSQRITGSDGVKGKTTFTQLLAGNYTIFEDGVSSAETAYAFCGYDVYNFANWYSSNGQIFIPLAQGDVVTCVWFNVPDDLTDSTGAIVVHKYVCNGTEFPAGYDYFANCAVESDGAKFAISVKQGDKFLPKTTGITNQNGLLSFGRLKPGTYSLKEVGDDWCHAKSDNVDASGNVIVRAGQRTNVWIFNCEPTKQPPNTGSGTMASVISGGSHGGGTAMAVMGILWPMLGFVGIRGRRKLRRAA